MTLNEYQNLAQRTADITGNDMEKKLLNGCMGMCGESGEAIDLYKKHKMQGHELDREAMIKETGDVLWYVAETAAALGVTLEEVAERNIAKLRKRYPEGFTPEHSIHREEYEGRPAHG